MAKKRRAYTFTELRDTGPDLCVMIANSALPPPDPEDRRKRRSSPPRLASYTDLVDLGRRAEALSPADAERLLRVAAERGDEAAEVFRRVLETRSFLVDLCQAFASGGPPSTVQLARINGYLAEIRPTLRVTSVGRGVSWGWEIGDDLGRIAWLIAVATAYLAEGYDRVRRCAGEGCRALFYDHSTNNQRRWCAMKGCGNAVKSRRAYLRHKAYVSSKSR